MSPTPRKLSSLSVFFPCYNEEKNIPLLVGDCLKHLPELANKYEIIIINDGSTDNTAKVASDLAKKHSEIRVIHHPSNKGYGASLQTGFKSAKHDWTFLTDGDRQFDISQLKEFIKYSDTCKAIIGYRTNRAEGPLRAFNAWLFKRFIDIIFRVHVRDIDCAFKLFQTKLTKTLPLKSDGAMISSEVLYRLKKQGIEFKQLPVTHLPRQYGSPTGNNPKVVLKAGVEAIKLYLHLKFKLFYSHTNH